MASDPMDDLIRRAMLVHHQYVEHDAEPCPEGCRGPIGNDYEAAQEVLDEAMEFCRERGVLLGPDGLIKAEWSGWSTHPRPNGLDWKPPHDKNSVHMDGCVPLFVLSPVEEP
jgi:hypothetical protein